MLTKSRKSDCEQHPKTLPAYLISSPQWIWCFCLAFHCCCAVKSSRLENMLDKSSNTLGLKNQQCAKLSPGKRLYSHCQCVFVITPDFCTLDNVLQHLRRTETQHVCARMCAFLRSEGERGQSLRGSVAWGHSGSKGSLQSEGRREPSPPHEP